MRAIWKVALLLVLALAPAAQAAAPVSGGIGTGLEPVAEVEYTGGMHLAVTRIKGRDYLFTSTSHAAGGGIRVFDVANPARPKLVATVPCYGGQAFLQVSHDRKTLIVGEDAPHDPDICFPAGEIGFYTIDISNPRKPKPAGVAFVEGGGHTVSAHPTKPIVYASYGDVAPEGLPAYEVWSIANPAEPKHLTTASVSGAHGPHDIEFSADGNWAVASSMTAIQVLDTSDPANPVEVEVLQCPGCTHNHEAHFTPDQSHVVVSDETAGGIASPCPMGALYFYEWDPDAEAEKHMNPVGLWQPGEAGVPADAPTNGHLCTSHVFGISPDGTKIAASWHHGGVRLVDITTMAGVGVGAHGTGAKEIGWYVAEGADSWSAKFDRSGRFVFVNDREMGLQVFRVGK